MTKPRLDRYVLGEDEIIYGFAGEAVVAISLREAQKAQKQLGRPGQLIIFKLVPVRRKAKK